MSRFKFRAYYKPTNEMMDVVRIDFSSGVVTLEPRGDTINENTVVHAIEEEAHLMMSTLHTTKEGVEIFEEDILVATDYSTTVPRKAVIGVVRYDPALARFMVIQALPSTQKLMNFTDILKLNPEVAGNMFEDSEVLG